MAKRIVDSVVFAFLKSLNAIRLYPRDVPWTIKASGFIALAREKEREREREREGEREAEREREREFMRFNYFLSLSVTSAFRLIVPKKARLTIKYFSLSVCKRYFVIKCIF